MLKENNYLETKDTNNDNIIYLYKTSNPTSSTNDHCNFNDCNFIGAKSVPRFNFLIEDCVGVICGWVQKKLLESMKCNSCTQNLQDPGFASKCELLLLQRRKDLIPPHRFLIHLGNICENFMRVSIKNKNHYRNPKKVIIKALTICQDQNFLIFFNPECVNNGHILEIISKIVKYYFRIRNFHFSKICSLNRLRPKTLGVRKKFTKLTLFNNQ